MSDARTEVLRRIAVALGRPSVPPAATDPAAVSAAVSRSYRVTDDRPSADLLDLLAERLADYGAGVAVVGPQGVAAAVAGAVASRGGGRVLAAPGMDEAWLAELPAAETDDPPRSPPALTEVDTAVTACAVAIAETGTVILDHRPDQGRRVLSLVPDHHVCVVRHHQVVASVPQAVRALDPRRPLTWISGPSATSDIELARVAGVHGPRRLDVVVVAPA